MKKHYSNKAEVCYKDVCAKFYNQNANIITVAVLAVIIVIGASVASKTLNFKIDPYEIHTPRIQSERQRLRSGHIRQTSKR